MSAHIYCTCGQIMQLAGLDPIVVRPCQCTVLAERREMAARLRSIVDEMPEPPKADRGIKIHRGTDRFQVISGTRSAAIEGEFIFDPDSVVSEARALQAARERANEVAGIKVYS